MGKFDTWSIKCNLCDWQWETCSCTISKHPKCEQCGSTNCDVKKNDTITIKKKGKRIIDIVDSDIEESSGNINGEIFVKTTKTDRPLLIIKNDFCKLSEDLSENERKNVLKQIDEMKYKIICDILDCK